MSVLVIEREVQRELGHARTLKEACRRARERVHVSDVRRLTPLRFGRSRTSNQAAPPMLGSELHVHVLSALVDGLVEVDDPLHQETYALLRAAWRVPEEALDLEDAW